MKAEIRFLWGQISKKKNFQVEVTNSCNLRCPACPWHTVMTRELHTMTVEEWDIIFDKIKKEAKSIGFYIMGEPLLNKNIFKFIKDAKREGIYTQFSTNGMLVGKYVDEIISCGLDQLQVALDGFNAETHEAYRVGSDFAKIIYNLELLQKRKNELGITHPEIHIQTLVNKKNENQINDIKRYCEKNGFVFRCKLMHLGRDKNTISKLKDEFETTNETYKRYGKNTNYYKYKDICPQLNNFSVLSNGDVTPCCFDYDGSVLWGNLVTDSWKSIKYGKRRINFLLSFMRKKNDLCNKCDMC